MNFQQWLDTFLNFEKLPQKNIFWLDMMECLAKIFGNPEGFAPCVHVAGSKGKGSVSRMISSILSEAGLKTGLYSSPHILSFYERITQNGNFFPNEIYEKCADELRSAIDSALNSAEEGAEFPLPKGRSVTWFEIVTIYAFLCFRAAKVDASVLEVGLGGKLDATNIVRPEISVINTIELEHTEFLGDTIEKIAAEKAGIIKEKTPVLCASCPDSVREVFRKKASEMGAPIFFADDLLESLEFSYGQNEGERGEFFMTTEFSSRIFSRPIKAKMRLLGEVQAQNAFLAAAAVRIAFPKISEAQIERGLEKASLRARFETMPFPKCENLEENGEKRFFVLDGAHTAQSIRGTLETFDSIFGENGIANACGKKSGKIPAHLLFACAADKDIERIAKVLKKACFQKITLTSLNGAKKSDPKKCAEAFEKEGIEFTLEENIENALESALKFAAKENAVLLATGSFYLAAEILENLTRRKSARKSTRSQS
ncbi:MAG: bifunctional folylpolyglutamate synthase/dihydrofolate synthase [Treponema sp.]|nr:bifunctional folylpolyglutamate synthase/dihydrofolate synthase [Treponema sp.]